MASELLSAYHTLPNVRTARCCEGTKRAGLSVGAQRTICQCAAAAVRRLGIYPRNQASKTPSNLVIVVACARSVQRRICIHVPAHAHRRLRFEQNCSFVRGRSCDLTKRCDVVENPDAACVCADNQIVVLDDQVTHRRPGHVEAKRLPVIAIVKRTTRCCSFYQLIALLECPGTLC